MLLTPDIPKQKWILSVMVALLQYMVLLGGPKASWVLFGSSACS
jgi:hypothetical protein